MFYIQPQPFSLPKKLIQDVILLLPTIFHFLYELTRGLEIVDLSRVLYTFPYFLTFSDKKIMDDFLLLECVGMRVGVQKSGWVEYPYRSKVFDCG